jgi:hypothetical protein
LLSGKSPVTEEVSEELCEILTDRDRRLNVESTRALEFDHPSAALFSERLSVRIAFLNRFPILPDEPTMPAVFFLHNRPTSTHEGVFPAREEAVWPNLNPIDLSRKAPDV